jgi:prepilin-type N-terminal cleavage/methylation domain-containing protein
MKASGPSSARTTGYTLVEVLVAMSIIALAIGAASQLSLSQSLTEELVEQESHAINYGENAARLWQLGIDDPAAILLASPNSDGTLMSCVVDGNLSTAGIQAPGNVDGGEDYGFIPAQVDRTYVAVTWQPQGGTSATQFSFQVVRPKPDRR